MKIVKIVLFMSGIMGAAEQVVSVGATVVRSPSQTSCMSNLVKAINVPSSFGNLDFIDSCDMHGTPLIVTSSKNMIGGLWTVDKDNQLQLLTSIVSSRDFHLPGEIQDLRLLSKSWKKLFMAVRYQQGIEVYHIASEELTTLQHIAYVAAAVPGVLARTVMAGAGAVVNVIRPSQQRTPTPLPSVESEATACEPRVVAPRHKPHTEYSWSVSGVPGGAIGTLGSTRDMTMHRSATGEQSIFVLHDTLSRVDIGETHCVHNSNCDELNRTLNAEFATVNNIQAMASSESTLVLGGLSKSQKGFLIVNCAQPTRPEKIHFLVDPIGKLDKFTMPLLTGMIALLHKKGIDNASMGSILQKLNTTTKHIVSVTSDYVVAKPAHDDSIVQQYVPDEGNWLTGQWVMCSEATGKDFLHENRLIHFSDAFIPSLHLPQPVKDDHNTDDLETALDDGHHHSVASSAVCSDRIGSNFADKQVEQIRKNDVERVPVSVVSTSVLPDALAPEKDPQLSASLFPASMQSVTEDPGARAAASPASSAEIAQSQPGAHNEEGQPDNKELADSVAASVPVDTDAPAASTEEHEDEEVSNVSTNIERGNASGRGGPATKGKKKSKRGGK